MYASTTNLSAGYIIAFRHAEAIMEPFARFTASFRFFVPSLRYDAQNGHTTITVHEKQPLPTFQPNPSTLKALCQIIAQIDKQLWSQVRIDFQNWYFNHETIIVAGEPNDVFWQVAEQVQMVGTQFGLDLRMPWGAHMTAGRFTEPCNTDAVKALRNCLYTAPILGVSVPIAIDVGYYLSSEKGFTLHISQSFC